MREGAGDAGTGRREEEERGAGASVPASMRAVCRSGSGREGAVTSAITELRARCSHRSSPGRSLTSTSTSFAPRPPPRRVERIPAWTASMNSWTRCANAWHPPGETHHDCPPCCTARRDDARLRDPVQVDAHSKKGNEDTRVWLEALLDPKIVDAACKLYEHLRQLRMQDKYEGDEQVRARPRSHVHGLRITPGRAHACVVPVNRDRLCMCHARVQEG